MIYVSHAQLPRPFYTGRTMGVLVRADPASEPAAALKRVVRELDADASLSSIRQLDELAGAAVAQPKFMGWIMAIFAVIALLVASLGVYGVVACGAAADTGNRRPAGAWCIAAKHRRAHRATDTHDQSQDCCSGLSAAAGLAWWLRSLLFEVEPFAVPVCMVCVWSWLPRSDWPPSSRLAARLASIR